MKSEFNKLIFLVKRNIKLYFKDKMTFFVSLLTPLILIVLFLTFLRGVYESTVLNILPEGMQIEKTILDAFTGGWLFSSILAVSCVTVAFCSNIMVLDKINDSVRDFKISPVKSSTLLSSYAVSNFITTFLICLIIFAISLVYLAIVGFFLSFTDIIMLLLSTVVMVAFGSLLASVIGFFLSSQGAHSAVSSLVSSLYGFICGAYMPISQFGSGMKTLTSLLPGTYGTVLFRQYYMSGVMAHLKDVDKIPPEIVDEIFASFDGKMVAFGTSLPTYALFVIVLSACLILFGLYILLSIIKRPKKLPRENNPLSK